MIESEANLGGWSVDSFSVYRWLTSIGCLILLALGCAESEQSSGRLVVSGKDLHDFGQSRQAEVLSHTFTLVNETENTVRIAELKTSCGCLVAGGDEGPDKFVIASGESVGLPVRLTTNAAQESVSGVIIVGYRHGDDVADTGPVDYVDMRVRAEVIPDYRIAPKEIDFGTVDGLTFQSMNRLVRVIPEADDDVQILDVFAPSELVSTRLLPKAKGEPGFDIAVDLDVSQLNNTGSVRTSIVITTNSERAPKSIVKLRADYQAPIEVTPDSVIIQSDVEGVVERTVHLKTTCSARIADIRCASSRGVRAIFDGQVTANEHTVQVEVAQLTGVALESELEFELELIAPTKKSVFYSVRVPVYRFLRKG
jgi:hypothetical protein